MKGRQIAMDSALADLDRYEMERERRETDAIKARLDEKYGRADYQKLKNMEYPEGSVGQRGDHRAEPFPGRTLQMALLPDGDDLSPERSGLLQGVFRGGQERRIPGAAAVGGYGRT